MKFRFCLSEFFKIFVFGLLMKKIIKRIQLIHRTNVGKCTKFWQTIDWKKMITLEHVWNDINQHLVSSSLNKKYQFYCYKTKQILPAWYHVDLLNDNDQILIEELMERYLKE